MANKFRHQLPYGSVAAESHQRWHEADHGAEIMKGLVCKLFKSDGKDLFRLRDEFEIPIAVFGGNASNLSERVLHGSAVVEVAAVWKTKAIPRIEVDEFYIVFKSPSVQREKLLKQERRRNHGRPCVVAVAVSAEYLSTPPWSRAPVNEFDIVTLSA
jgi:hypothetical protein